MTVDLAGLSNPWPADVQGAWQRLLAVRDVRGLDAGALGLPEPWASVYGPLAGRPEASRVVAQLGQSLDGRVATPTGHSHYVNGRAAIVHLHRLRALSDAVVVGASTVIADDPALTVRHVDGPSPCRVVIDPAGRTPPRARWLAEDGVRRIVLVRPGVAPDLPAGVERIAIAPTAEGSLSPQAIVAELAACGLPRVLVEGGAYTVSRFIASRGVDRLHLLVAPIVIGSGPVGLSLPPIERLDAALRPAARCVSMGEDVLWDLMFERPSTAG